MEPERNSSLGLTYGILARPHLSELTPWASSFQHMSPWKKNNIQTIPIIPQYSK
jgi:hypothetical protein